VSHHQQIIKGTQFPLETDSIDKINKNQKLNFGKTKGRKIVKFMLFILVLVFVVHICYLNEDATNRNRKRVLQTYNRCRGTHSRK